MALQVVEELPIGLSIKERIPEDRVALVIPGENSIRYGEMQLRSRSRNNHLMASKATTTVNTLRELTPDEVCHFNWPQFLLATEPLDSNCGAHTISHPC